MNATKHRFGRPDLPALLDGARRVIVAKGRKSAEFQLAARAPLSDELVDAVLGPTGNLRAPALRVGTTWLVGFHEESWDSALG